MRKLERMLLPGAAAMAIAAAAAWAHPGHPPITPPVVSFTAAKAIPFDLFRDQRIFLNGTVNGHATSMMVDSGAGSTVVDTAYARQLGLPAGTTIAVRGANGDAQGQLVSGVTLDVGSLRLDKLTVLVMDIAETGRAIGRPIRVVLGRDAFMAGIVRIDFPRRRISFSDRASFMPPKGALRLALEDGGSVKRIKLSVAGLPPVDADVDLGNGGTVVLGNAYWTRQPTLAALRSAQAQISGIGGTKPARRTTLPAVQLGDRRYFSVPATFNDDPQTLPRDGANVGTEMFKPFVTTFDFRGNAIYLEGPREVRSLPRERAGVRSQLDGDHLHVIYVSPDGPAAAAGLKAGDEIVAVDGRKVGAGYYGRRDWSYGPSGTPVMLTRSDGSTVTFKLADYY